MRARTRLAMVGSGLALAVALAAPSAHAVQFDPNPWRGFGFLNMAHQGGENEAPSSTLFAFKSAIAARGADTLELDVNMTMDDRLVVIHNDTVNSTTNVTDNRASGNSEVNDLTLAQVQALDAGYSFRGNGIYDDNYVPASDYTYRGMRTGAVPPPPGYTPDDFAHPTLEQVLDAFPNTPINIEIKMIKTTTGAASGGGGCQTQGVLTYCDDAPGSIPVAEKLAEVLNRPEYASRNDLLVVSFAQLLVNRFNELAPQVAIAPAAPGVLAGSIGVQPIPDVSAFQVPPRFPGIPMLPEMLLAPPASAHDKGYAVHVFTQGDQDENDAAYQRFTSIGVEGVMSSNPGRLHAYLCSAGVRRPDGSARCPAQVIAPITPVIPPTTTPEPSARCAGKVATIVGTPGRDTLRGTPKRDVIAGLGGKDTLVGRGGNDIICGNGGHNRIFGGPGNDRLIGGPRSDRIAGGQGRDVLIGRAGNDLLSGGPGRDKLKAGKGKKDRCKGGGGKDKGKGCEKGNV